MRGAKEMVLNKENGWVISENLESIDVICSS